MYETKFEDGRVITQQLAKTLISEVNAGLIKDIPYKDNIKAWSYLIGTGDAYIINDWFSHSATNIINTGVISDKGDVDWDMYDDE